MHIFRPWEFQKDPAKTVGGVAFRRLNTFSDGQTESDAQGKTISLRRHNSS